MEIGAIDDPLGTDVIPLLWLSCRDFGKIAGFRWHLVISTHLSRTQYGGYEQITFFSIK